jgi:predicted DNA-binding transcriptional regulator AlpA
VNDINLRDFTNCEEEVMIDMATPEEVAEALHTTTAGLAQMRYRGNGPKFVRLGERRVLYRWSDIEDWIAASTRTRSDT